MPGPNRQRHKTAKYIVERNPHTTRNERRLRGARWWIALAALVGVQEAMGANKRGRARVTAGRKTSRGGRRQAKIKAMRRRARIDRARTFNWKRKGV